MNLLRARRAIFSKTFGGTFSGILLAAVLLTGCATRNEQLRSVDALVYMQKFAEAGSELEGIQRGAYGAKSRALYAMDRGLLSFYAGDIAASRASLQKADDLMEEYRTKSAGEAVGSVLINDTVRTYAGSPYENIFASVMLMLGYLAEDDFDGGFVELRRAQNKISRLQTDYNVRLEAYNKSEDARIKLEQSNVPFADSALVRLLSFWMYRADGDITNMEVAARKYNEAVAAQRALYEGINVPKLDEQNSFRPDDAPARVHVVSFTGRVPIKVEQQFAVNSVPHGLIITSRNERISNTASAQLVRPASLEVLRLGFVIPLPGMRPGIAFVLAVPMLARLPSPVARINLAINGKPAGFLAPTESFERIALASFEAESRMIYARAFSRAAAKMLLGVGVREGVNAASDAPFGDLLGILLQITNNATEKADTRSVRYYPATVWTADVPLAASGSGELTLTYLSGGGQVLHQTTKKFTAKNKNASITIVSDAFLQ